MQKMRSHIFVANWKMCKNLKSSVDFVKNNHKELKELGEKNIPIVLCPSLAAIPFVVQELDNAQTFIGAQNCSGFECGAYTGETSVQTLAEVGCTFCIVGHSERRQLFNETIEEVVLKTKQLINNKLIPIICIGETAAEHKEQQTVKILEKQLGPVLNMIKENRSTERPFCIAYEPVWAIGTGVVPTIKKLEETFKWLQTFIGKYNIEDYALLYGGSVNAKNSTNLKSIGFLDGFLVGGASLDFQELKKIVLS
ncbi:triosephosphate isomerase [bacterium]|jgi:triosephosphate isomerase (TIM)|nr:triosephosphate isomerase [bacterium]